MKHKVDRCQRLCAVVNGTVLLPTTGQSSHQRRTLVTDVLIWLVTDDEDPPPVVGFSLKMEVINATSNRHQN